MAPPPRYSTAQLNAFLHEVLDKGSTVAAAIRKASAGELDGVDAFPISRASAYHHVDKARLERAQAAAQSDPAAAGLDFAQQALAALAPEAHRQILKARTGKPQHIQLRDIAKTYKDLVALAKTAGLSRPARKPSPEDREAKGEPAPVDIASLLQQAQDTQAQLQEHTSPQEPEPSTGHEPGSVERASEATPAAHGQAQE